MRTHTCSRNHSIRVFMSFLSMTVCNLWHAAVRKINNVLKIKFGRHSKKYDSQCIPDTANCIGQEDYKIGRREIRILFAVCAIGVHFELLISAIPCSLQYTFFFYLDGMPLPCFFKGREKRPICVVSKKKQAKYFVQHHTHKVCETFCPVPGVELFVSVMESVELCVQEYVRVSAASPSVTTASRFTVGPSPTVWSSPAYAAG